MVALRAETRPYYDSSIEEVVAHKQAYGLNLLAEVDVLMANHDCWEEDTSLDPQLMAYLHQNAYTAASEAVDPGGYFWSDTRRWVSTQAEFYAFNQPMSQMLQNGIEYVNQQINDDHDHPLIFERRREIIELQVEEDLSRAYRQGDLPDGIYFNVSAYPEEVAESDAALYGYKPKQRLAKLRFEVFDQGQRTTIDISVANSRIDILGQLAGLQPEQTAYFSSEDLLGLTRYLGPIPQDGSSIESTLRVVEDYDILLSQRYGGDYFFGRRVAFKTDKNYQGVVEKRKGIFVKGQPLVDQVVNLDIELAKSLSIGTITEYIESKTEYWLGATNKAGQYLLNQKERNHLSRTFLSGTLSREAAEVLKKCELTLIWSSMACLVDPILAGQKFGTERVAYVTQQLGLKRRIDDDLYTDLTAMSADPEEALLFELCGGSMGGFGRGLHGLRLTEIGNYLTLDPENDIWKCQRCHYIHLIDARNGVLVDYCKGCGLSGRC